MNNETLRNLRIALAGGMILGALNGSCAKPNNPNPVEPTPGNPNPTATLVGETPTVIWPTSTPEVKTPTPEATPTVIAINIPSARGPIAELTPTPDTQRETLTEKARLFYEKNPLSVNNNQLNGILVSERTVDNKILISIRTFRGVAENAILAGNWGYFSFNDKSEITGIVWATKDTVTDSQGKVGYLGDSEIATTGAGFFGAKQIGYWTREGKMIASLNPQNGEPIMIVPPTPVPPTATKEPTPTPKPTLTPNPTSTPEVVGNNTICAINEMAGNCYQRTPSRRGTMDDGHVLPDGVMFIHQMNPDYRVQMQWLFPGRILDINYSTNTIYIKGKNNDIFPVELLSSNPNFYARMLRVPSPTGVEFRQIYPQVSPRLGVDIKVGDYVTTKPLSKSIIIPNNINPQEAYQRTITAVNQGNKFVSAFIEIIQ